MSDERGEVVYGGRLIAFDVRHVDRDTLEIAVGPDGSVVVTAPLGVVYEDIHARVTRRARWIAGQQAYFAQFDPRTSPRRFVSGETHTYLGRQYRLRVVAGVEEPVKLLDGRFVVTLPNPKDSLRVEALLDAWYETKAERWMSERLVIGWERFAGRDLERPRLRLRRMRSRWGSLSPSGLLTLNVELVRAPIECIDYVIYHELCHLEHPDHGPGFRHRLDEVLPDWERRKHRLELALS